MILVAGLGNPGKQYEDTWHNVGFLALDAIAEHFGFSEFKLDKKSRSLVSEGRIGNQKVLLAKPQTFMNRSGEALQSLSRFYKILPPDIVIIHDDIDIPLGELKVVNAPKGSGSAGHKGVASVLESLGTTNAARFRIGILPQKGKPLDVEEFVLKNFTQDEKQTVSNIFPKLFETLTQLTE